MTDPAASPTPEPLDRDRLTSVLVDRFGEIPLERIAAVVERPCGTEAQEPNYFIGDLSGLVCPDCGRSSVRDGSIAHRESCQYRKPTDV